jgi:hypothetical protein
MMLEIAKEITGWEFKHELHGGLHYQGFATPYWISLTCIPCRVFARFFTCILYRSDLTSFQSVFFFFPIPRLGCNQVFVSRGITN